MSAIYGHIWQSQYRHADFLMLAKQEWQSTLENFSKETVEKAIHACRTHYELPPTLPQFYQLCKQFRPYPPPRGMQRDVKPCSPDVAAKHIARIRQMLKETGIYCQQPSGEKKPC